MGGCGEERGEVSIANTLLHSIQANISFLPWVLGQFALMQIILVLDTLSLILMLFAFSLKGFEIKFQIRTIYFSPCNPQSRFTAVFLFLEIEISRMTMTRFSNNPDNKKVLLCERKRHTARHVASTPYVVLTWLTPPPAAGPDPPTSWT